MYKFFFKRVMDILVAFFGIFLTLPITLPVLLILMAANQGSAFFIQKRPGKNGKVFKIIKFKTMNDKRDKDGKLLPDGDRLTWIGKLVRKTSLDEIPQLINVLKGDMSLIGPRPLLVEYLELYSPEQFRRHSVRPGITGWAQVKGRNSISWEKKFEYDVWYVEHLSFILDLKVIYLTLIKVIKSEGVNSNTSVTMEKFKGS